MTRDHRKIFDNFKHCGQEGLILIDITPSNTTVIDSVLCAFADFFNFILFTYIYIYMQSQYSRLSERSEDVLM